MGSTFGKLYTSAYDALYATKDYQAECLLLQSLVQKHLKGSDTTPQRLLDIGCGTGGHAIPLAKMGYEVTGIDPSATMLERAREKAAQEGVSAEFVGASSTSFEFSESFDVCISMFAVFCYHQTNEEILNAFRRIEQHLKPGGLFIIDFWFGPAVLRQQPERRERLLMIDGVEYSRIVTPSLDVCAHTVSTHYDLVPTEQNGKGAKTSETHVMRYFFTKELELFCSNVGLEVERFGAFPEFDEVPSEDTWNVMMIAKKPGGE